MTANLPPISVDGVARRNVDDALAAASDTDQKVIELTGQVAELARREAANGGLATTTTWVELGEATRKDTPVDIVNLPAGTSVQIVVDVVSGFPGDSVLQIAVAGQALPMSVWQETPLDPTTPGRYATPPIETGAAFVLTRRGIITATLVASGATSGMARVTLNHPPARRPHDGTLNVQDWGVLPTNDGATNTTALLALRDWCRARPDTTHRIVFPPSETPYRVKTSAYTKGIRRFHLSGYGATIINDIGYWTDPWYFSNTYYTNEGATHDKTGIEEGAGWGSAILSPGIESVQAQETVVTLKEPDTNIVAGANVLIHGLQQQNGGWPPNLGYFEYNKVRSVEGLNVTLVYPLKHSYYDDWPEVDGTGYGPAKMLPLNRPDYDVCEYALIEGIRFYGTHTPYGGNGYTIGVFAIYDILECYVRDVWCEKLYVGISNNVSLENVYVQRFHEPDKLVSTINYKNCNLPEISASIGVEHLNFDNCTIRNKQDFGRQRGSQVYATNILMEKCVFLRGQLDLGIQGYDRGKLILKDNTFHRPTTGQPIKHNGENIVQRYSPAELLDDETKTTGFRFVDNNAGGISRVIAEGMPFFAAKNAPNLDFIAGRVTRVRAADNYTQEQRDIIVEVDANGVAEAGSAFYIPSANKVVISNNAVVPAKAGPFATITDLDFDANRRMNYFSWEIKIDTNRAPLVSTYPIFGIVSRVDIEVLRPYTGPSKRTKVRFAIRRWEFVHHFLFDVTQRTVITKTLSAGDLPFSPSQEFRFVSENFTYEPDTSAWASPIVSVKLEVLNPVA